MEELVELNYKKPVRKYPVHRTPWADLKKDEGFKAIQQLVDVYGEEEVLRALKKLEEEEFIVKNEWGQIKLNPNQTSGQHRSYQT